MSFKKINHPDVGQVLHRRDDQGVQECHPQAAATADSPRRTPGKSLIVGYAGICILAIFLSKVKNREEFEGGLEKRKEKGEKKKKRKE